jgi:hypothetical protein
MIFITCEIMIFISPFNLKVQSQSQLIIFRQFINKNKYNFYKFT